MRHLLQSVANRVIGSNEIKIDAPVEANVSLLQPRRKRKKFTERRGNYGLAKYRAFTVMAQLGGKIGRDGYLGTRELAIYTGLPYRSLTKLLPKWVRYEYVTARACAVWGRGDNEYKLALHGSAWLECANKRLYNRTKFRDELQTWVNFIGPHTKLLLSMPFNPMVDYLAILRAQLGQN